MESGVDILIIGGGVQGLTLAYFLAKEGKRVQIVERGACGKEATWAGAGIIPPGMASTGAPVADRLRTLSSQRFPSLSAELQALTGINNGFNRCGSWHVPEKNGTLRALKDLCQREKFQLELPGRDRPWTGNREVEPLFLSGTMQVRNPWHVRALREACILSGVVIRESSPVEHISVRDGRVVSIETPSGSFSAKWFVLAAGAWSGELAKWLGLQLAVRPVRGVISLLELPGGKMNSIVEQGKRYIVPRGDGLFLVGSTEQDAGFDKTVELDLVEELEDWARQVLPELAMARRKASWGGLRPGSPDGLPFLGFCPGYQNLVLATGHHRAGLQLSPGSAQLLTELLTGKTVAIPLEPFSPERPQGHLEGGFLN